MEYKLGEQIFKDGTVNVAFVESAIERCQYMKHSMALMLKLATDINKNESRNKWLSMQEIVYLNELTKVGLIEIIQKEGEH